MCCRSCERISESCCWVRKSCKQQSDFVTEQKNFFPSLNPWAMFNCDEWHKVYRALVVTLPMLRRGLEVVVLIIIIIIIMSLICLQQERLQRRNWPRRKVNTCSFIYFLVTLWQCAILFVSLVKVLSFQLCSRTCAFSFISVAFFDCMAIMYLW